MIGRLVLGAGLTILLLASLGLSVVASSQPGISNMTLSEYNPNVDALVDRVMGDYNIPSTAAAIVRDNNIIWAKGYGELPALDTVYMVGSITKTFTTVAVMQLIEQGFFSLDDDVNSYIPFSLRNPVYPEIPITIRMLLSHTASLGSRTDNLYRHVYSDIITRIGITQYLSSWLEWPEWVPEYFQPNGSLYETSVWLSFEPGTHWAYANVGFDILAFLVEQVRGQPLEEYVKISILDPLGMENTCYDFSEIGNQSKLAHPHVYNWELFPGSGLVSHPLYNHLGIGPGALRSNILDLARYSLIFSHGGVSNGTRILREESINLICNEYLGWLDFGAEWDGHGGDVFGYISHMITNRGRGTSVPYQVIVFTNQWYSRGGNLEITYALADKVKELDQDPSLFPQAANPRDSRLVIMTSFTGLSSLLLLIVIVAAKKGRLGGRGAVT
ncbi:MAG: serine hydrolase domain-containing protein [Candidatus Thorarchaeota archaeon]|jgi:CubicO group peptidase (beta-lactamase class C family)